VPRRDEPTGTDGSPGAGSSDGGSTAAADAGNDRPTDPPVS
jgi:hypothetical protein